MQTFGIALAGLGNVGAGVFKHLAANRTLLRGRLGCELQVRRVAVPDADRNRSEQASRGRLRLRANSLLPRP